MMGSVRDWPCWTKKKTKINVDSSNSGQQKQPNGKILFDCWVGEPESERLDLGDKEPIGKKKMVQLLFFFFRDWWIGEPYSDGSG